MSEADVTSASSLDGSVYGPGVPEFTGGYGGPLALFIDILKGIAYPLTPHFWVGSISGWCVAWSLLYFYLGRQCIRSYAMPKDDRRREWVPSLLSSFLLSVVGFFAALQFVCLLIFKKDIWAAPDTDPTELSILKAIGRSTEFNSQTHSLPNAQSHEMTGLRSTSLNAGNDGFRTVNSVEHAASKLLTSSLGSRFIVTFFLTFVIYDSLRSYLFYPGHMELLAGWIHHFVYFILGANALRWNFCYALCVMFVEEIPTCALALGQIYPDTFKSEWFFGMSFLILRLMFHAAIVTIAFIYTRKKSAVWSAGALAFLVHLWWFIGWIHRQQRLAKAKRRVSLRGADPALDPQLGQTSWPEGLSAAPPESELEKETKELKHPHVYDMDSIFIDENAQLLRDLGRSLKERRNSLGFGSARGSLTEPNDSTKNSSANGSPRGATAAHTTHVDAAAPKLKAREGESGASRPSSPSSPQAKTTTAASEDEERKPLLRKSPL